MTLNYTKIVEKWIGKKYQWPKLSAEILVSGYTLSVEVWFNSIQSHLSVALFMLNQFTIYNDITRATVNTYAVKALNFNNDQFVQMCTTVRFL